MNWIKFFGINNFNHVISRDQIQNQNKRGFYIVNLDNKQGPGTHWVAMKIGQHLIEYFDSFGLNCPMEVVSLSNKIGINYVYNSTQYQDLNSVLCGYYCLFFINERHKNETYYDIIKKFSNTDHANNERLITRYFI